MLMMSRYRLCACLQYVLRIEQLLDGEQQRCHLLLCADADSYVVLQLARLKIANENAAFAQFSE